MTKSNTVDKLLSRLAGLESMQSVPLHPAGFPEPVSIYVNWAAYDILSDDVPLTEELAITQLDHLLRLKREGVQFDYYLMDCFWFDPEGGYRTWDRRHWSQDGPMRWIARCQENGVLPGLWVAGNTLRNGIFRHFTAWPSAWNDSLDPENRAACLFHGSYLTDFLAALQFWADRGVRMFKFDFMEFDAAPSFIRTTCLPSEIWERNCEAYRLGLKSFRARNPEVKLIAYNGLWEAEGKCSHETGSPFRKMIDTRWLEVFDSVYCGDPRPADVPCSNFWRAKDIYSDHMVRYFESNGFPLPRIDNAGFMIGTTGTCYYRGKQAWRGMLLLSLARGGWANTYYGNLDLLSDDDACWFAKAQRIFLELQRTSIIRTFGGVPGRAEPYGFWAHRADTDVLTVVNPSQVAQTVQLPACARRVLFRDTGFEPVLDDTSVTLGAEQIAVVASGQFAESKFELGLEPDVLVPLSIEPVEAELKLAADGKSLTVICAAPQEDRILRAIFRQSRNGKPLRTTGGAPPGGVSLGRLLRLTARQGDRDVPVRADHDKVIWSGLSWVVGEIDGAKLDPVAPLTLVFSTSESPPLEISAELKTISYGGTRVRQPAAQSK